MLLPTDTLARLVAALVADELGRLRGRPVDAAERLSWGPATPVDEDGVGADSLARLEMAARLNQFFHMHESGAEDYLLVRRTLGDWTGIVAESLSRAAERVTFRTSGSTGAAKAATHALADLAAEADAQAALLPEAERVVALVPPHHIYGFLATALGPARRGLPVLDAQGLSPAAVAARLAPGDLIVATPFLWGVLLRSGARVPAGATGLTSTAPAPPALWDEAAAAGLGRLVEFYGASETAGVGWREAGAAPFRLFAHLIRDGRGALRRRRDGAAVEPPDALTWTADGRFRPAGRRDGAVQVGGVNVWPERVRAALLENPLVADCAVRLDGAAGGSARLKGFVVPKPDARGRGADALADELARFCAERLSAPERPVRFAFGSALPRNEIGKLRDWS